MRACIRFKDGSTDWLDVPFGCRGSYCTVIRHNPVATVAVSPRRPGPLVNNTITCKWVECVRDAHGQITHDVFQE